MAGPEGHEAVHRGRVRVDPERLQVAGIVVPGRDDPAFRQLAVQRAGDGIVELELVEAVPLLCDDAADRVRQRSEAHRREGGLGLIVQNRDHRRHHLGVTSIEVMSPICMPFSPAARVGKRLSVMVT